MTQQELCEIARRFFGKAMRIDAQHARITIKNAGTNLQRAVFSVDFGARRFEVDINRYDNQIKLTEVIINKKWGFDRRNPLNGYIQRTERCERLIRADRLDNY